MNHDIPKLITLTNKLFLEFGSTLILEALANEIHMSAKRLKLSDDEKRKVIGSDLQTYAEVLTKLLLVEPLEP